MAAIALKSIVDNEILQMQALVQHSEVCASSWLRRLNRIAAASGGHCYKFSTIMNACSVVCPGNDWDCCGIGVQHGHSSVLVRFPSHLLCTVTATQNIKEN